MAAVGEVEAFVAEGEVGDLLAAEGVGEGGPVVEGGVDDFVAADVALGIGKGDVGDFAAPAFDEGDDEVVGFEGAEGGDGVSAGEGFGLFADELDGVLDFEPADVGAGEDVAGVPRGEGDLREAVDAGGVGEADVLGDAGGAGQGGTGV